MSGMDHQFVAVNGASYDAIVASIRNNRYRGLDCLNVLHYRAKTVSAFPLMPTRIINLGVYDKYFIIKYNTMKVMPSRAIYMTHDLYLT
jgi:hypothetical protein